MFALVLLAKSSLSVSLHFKPVHRYVMHYQYKVMCIYSSFCSLLIAEKLVVYPEITLGPI
jgi:hypothetical protein